MIEIYNITTNSNNNTLRKVNIKPYGFDKMYMDKELKGTLYQIIDQLNERKNTSTMFYSTHLNKRYPFYDRNGRTCQIQSANDDIIRQNI